jgi:hypothetical protein
MTHHGTGRGHAGDVAQLVDTAAGDQLVVHQLMCVDIHLRLKGRVAEG